MNDIASLLRSSGAGAFPSATLWAKAGGAMGSRTPDLLIANETLYQLSYDPIPRYRNSIMPYECGTASRFRVRLHINDRSVTVVRTARGCFAPLDFNARAAASGE